MSVLICVSATEAETERLLCDGPRRDFIELAHATDGRVLYQPASKLRNRVGRKLAGPHIRQAWHAASIAQPGDTVFADGEHIGIPLLAFLLLRFRRGVRVVMLGHLVARRWKALPLAVLTRMGPAGTLVVHSVTQVEKIRVLLGRGWELRLVPYQVDTDFWRAESAAPPAISPTILAVGSENRDYATLSEAVRGLNVHVRIAAGSHWARRVATAGNVPSNVEYLTQPLPYSELRCAYQSAALVVVPLADVQNQSGVTTILEAMSMSRPVITTANSGQRECVSGPTVDGDGRLHEGTTNERGPRAFGDAAEFEAGPDGYYVSPGDSGGLRAAITRLLESPKSADAMGAAGRKSAAEHFTLERYVDTLRSIIEGPAASQHISLERRVAR